MHVFPPCGEETLQDAQANPHELEKRSYNQHTEIYKVIKEHYKCLFASKFNNLEETDKFLETKTFQD